MKKISTKVLIVIGLLFLMILLIDIYGDKAEQVSNDRIVYNGFIILDPGHGGNDEGTSGYSKTYEKDLALEISLKLKKVLMENNFKVYMTREDDKLLGNSPKEDISNRSKFINLKNPDIFLSIHLNGSEEKVVKGAEIYARYLDKKSYSLAEKIQDELSSIEYTKDRGVKTTKDRSLGILRKTEAPGVLLELGFITNKEDEEYLVSEVGQDTIIEAILNGILEYFKERD